MKYFLCVFTSIILTSISTGQSLSNLDKKYGIGVYKLESSFDTFKDLEFFYELDDGQKFYKYKGTKSLQMFGIIARELYLGFFKNKLYSISYHFDPLHKIEENTIRTNMIELFGKPKEGDNSSSENYEWGNVWETQKVYLHFAKNKPNSDTFANYFEVIMFSSILKKQILNSSF